MVKLKKISGRPAHKAACLRKCIIPESFARFRPLQLKTAGPAERKKKQLNLESVCICNIHFPTSKTAI